jgi:hypothetical protein
MIQVLELHQIPDKPLRKASPRFFSQERLFPP